MQLRPAWLPWSGLLLPEIKDLLSRLKSGKLAGINFVFADRVRAAEEQANIQIGQATKPADTMAFQKATIGPRGAVLSAWLDRGRIEAPCGIEELGARPLPSCLIKRSA